MKVAYAIILAAFAAVAVEGADIEGVVTFWRPPDQYFFMETASGVTWRVQRDTKEPRISVGDIVSVGGHDIKGIATPRFKADVVRLIEHDPKRLPKPERVSFAELLVDPIADTNAVNRYGRIVTVDGILRDVNRRHDSGRAAPIRKDDMIRVLIVDDHPIVRDGLEVLLASEKGLSIHGSVASAEEAVALCEKMGAPDVVVTDIHMPGGMTGLELAARLKKVCPSTRVLLLAGMPLKAEVDEARSIGAAGYLPKSSKRGVLATAIRRVVAEPGMFVEEAYVQPKTILSAREAEILKYMALGKTREEIAIILGIGFETVRTHTKNLIVKLDAPNSTGAVSRAYELGLLRA